MVLNRSCWCKKHFLFNYFLFYAAASYCFINDWVAEQTKQKSFVNIYKWNTFFLNVISFLLILIKTNNNNNKPEPVSESEALIGCQVAASQPIRAHAALRALVQVVRAPGLSVHRRAADEADGLLREGQADE